MLEDSSRPQSFKNEVREFQARIENVPSYAKVKGMYIESFLCTLDKKGLPRPTKTRYLSFKDYPLVDYMRLLLEACPVLHPGRGIREALKLQGRMVYPILLSSTVGKVIFAIAGRSFEAALPLASRGWEISLNPGSASLVEVTPNSATLALRDVYNFADCFQVGVMEGAMDVFSVKGIVTPKMKDRICDVDLIMTWSKSVTR